MMYVARTLRGEGPYIKKHNGRRGLTSKTKLLKLRGNVFTATTTTTTKTKTTKTKAMTTTTTKMKTKTAKAKTTVYLIA